MHPPNHSISACSTMSPMPIPASVSAQQASHFSCSSRRFRRRRAPRPGTSSPPMAPWVLGLSQLPAQGPPPRSTQRAATVACRSSACYAQLLWGSRFEAQGAGALWGWCLLGRAGRGREALGQRGGSPTPLLRLRRGWSVSWSRARKNRASSWMKAH